MNCVLCNEPIEPLEFTIGEAQLLDESCWHVACLEEYAEEYAGEV